MPETPADYVFKTHLFRDNSGEKFRNGATNNGWPMANTLCRGNYHNYKTTMRRSRVKCSLCLRRMGL